MSDLEVSDDFSPSSPPAIYQQHCVGVNESLASIAIKFDSTLSELAQLNKLSSHMIFPGQKLKVPFPDTLPHIPNIKKPPASPSLPIARSEAHSRSVRFSSQFSSFEDISLPKSPPELETQVLDNSFPRASPGDEVTDTLVRIRAKYITLNKGCARGKLHLTPQSVIFEPDTNDQLVVLQGKEEFAVILSMQSISDVTVTSDFMKFISNCPPTSSPQRIPAKCSPAKSRPPTKDSQKSNPLACEGVEADTEIAATCSTSSDLCQDSTESNQGDIIHPMFLLLTTIQTPLDTFDSPPATLFSRLTKHKTDPDSQQLKRVKSRSDYLFAIPNSHSDSLYAFFITWSPSMRKAPTNKLDDQRSFSLQFKEDHISPTCPTSLPSHSWAVLPSVDVIRDMDYRAAADAVPLPRLVGKASLLDESLLRELNYLLPSRTVGHDLWLVYSSFVHGISLRTMYRNMERCTGPIVFILRDNQQWVFGGVVSCPLRVSDHYYGTGESFMFRVAKESQKVEPYFWTGCNTFFVKGDHDSISFGGGNGRPALWLDGDFYNGSSFPCNTFDNCQLSCNEDFLCTGFESWGFVEWNS